MELLRPQKLKRPNYSVSFGIASSFEHTDPVLDVSMTKTINIVSMNSETSNHVPSPKRPSEEQIKTYAAMQSLIKSCVDNAEDIKERLHQIVVSQSFPQNEKERRNIMKMDFMSIKKWFLDDIRSKKIYKHLTGYESTKKFKNFSRPLNDFVLDRNVYTHGQLSLLSPDFEYIIEYTEPHSQHKEYAFITIEILKSYNAFYREIQKVIAEYRKHI